MEVDLQRSEEIHSDPHKGVASPPPYDPMLPTPSVAHLQATPNNQVTRNFNPVSMDTPTETPHDLFCLAKEYERRGRMSDAANLYLKASMNGHLSAMVSYASQLVDTDERAAFVWFRAAAERGDPRAWAELGQLLARGRYFEVNAIDAARCWKRAAQMGDNTGKSALGLCYIRGFGVRQDPEKGVEIVRQVADVHNDVTAMKNLAWIYRHGKGVPKNFQEAEYWENRARKQEDVMAHVTSREQVLFGRGRYSRHSRYKTRDSERPSTRPPVPTNGISSENTTTSRDLAIKPATIVEEDLQHRLRVAGHDRSAHATEAADDKSQTPDEDNRREETEQFKSISVTEVDYTSKEQPHQKSQPITVTSIEDTTGTEQLPTFAERVRELDRRARESLEGTSEKLDPELRAEVRGLKFTPSHQSDSTIVTDAGRIDLSAPKIDADRSVVTAHSKQESITQSSVVVQYRAVERGVRSTERVPEKSSELADENSEEHFITPEQSLDNEAEEPSSGVSKPVVTPVAAASSVGLSHTQQKVVANEYSAKESDTAENNVESTPTGAREEDSSAPETSKKLSMAGVERAAATGTDTADMKSGEENIPSDVKSRAMLFETPVSAKEGGSGGGSGGESGAFSASRRGNSYSLGTSNVDADAIPGNEELDEFEEADMQRIAAEAPGAQESHTNGTLSSGNVTKGSLFRKPSIDQQTMATNGNGVETVEPLTRSALANTIDSSNRIGVTHSRDSPNRPGLKESRTSSLPIDIITGRSPIRSTVGDTNESSTRYTSVDSSDQLTHTALRDLMALYPKNPLRSDSQVPLFKLLDGIQRLPLSDFEAFKILEEGNGFSKVIVAMLSQHEDPYLQEQGLYSIIRVLRAAPSSQREALVLSSYGDCYRNAQGDMDAVIPKGSLGLDERSSGAVQAIVHALRHHSSVRRVQLAGCGALNEVAILSPSCRSTAYDHGAVSLIVTCLRHRSSQAGATIHDFACRAVTGFCVGKESAALKEAFTSAGIVNELLNVLQLWGHAEHTSRELPVTATKSCCNALRYITEGYPVAAGQCVQSFIYHHLVRAMTLRREDVSVCTVVVSAMTSITRNAGAIAEKGLLDAKPLSEVLVTMQTHSEQSLFICKALDFIESLSIFDTLREEVVNAGGIPFATDIIQQGGNDAMMLERACGVIEKLCRSHPKHQELFIAQNGIFSLTGLLKTHQSLPGVVERTLLALASACSGNSRAQKEAVKAGTPEQVVRCIGGYSSKNAKVAAAGSSAVTGLVVPRNTGTAQGLSRLKAPEHIIRTMKKHPDSVVIQENGSAAIASICEADPNIISTLLKSGVSGILVGGLQRFLHRQGAVVQIVRAMRAISNESSVDSYRFKSKLLTDRSNESSLSEIFHTALSYHKKALPDTANVIISICATINRLCMKSVAFKNEIGKDGIVEELKRLVERTAEFKDIGALQPVLATICTLVLDSEDNKNRFHAVGGVEAILDVMQKWKSDTYVLEHCCAALRYSCNEHFGNCNEVKNHNGVRSILGVMELHPENVNVTLWCCLTLADLCKGDEELQSSPNVVQGIRKVVSAMNMFSSNSRFLASACEFLRAVSADNMENQERIVRLGGRTAIIKAMEAHPEDNNLTESGAYALLQVQDVQDARTSVDSNPQLGLVRRLSRDLRRSGSSSARSKSSRSSGKLGLLGRKSKSFSSRRRPADEMFDDNPLSEAGGEGIPPSRNVLSRTSFMSFSRGSKNRSRKSRAEGTRVEELGDEPEVEGAIDDDYDEYQVPAQEGGFGQID